MRIKHLRHAPSTRTRWEILFPETGPHILRIVVARSGSYEIPATALTSVRFPLSSHACLCRGSFTNFTSLHGVYSAGFSHLRFWPLSCVLLPHLFRDHLADKPDLNIDGPHNVVFWNGPFIPGFLKRFEVHLPVRIDPPMDSSDS